MLKAYVYFLAFPATAQHRVVTWCRDLIEFANYGVPLTFPSIEMLHSDKISHKPESLFSNMSPWVRDRLILILEKLSLLTV